MQERALTDHPTNAKVLAIQHGSSSGQPTAPPFQDVSYGVPHPTGFQINLVPSGRRHNAKSILEANRGSCAGYLENTLILLSPAGCWQPQHPSVRRMASCDSTSWDLNSIFRKEQGCQDKWTANITFEESWRLRRRGKGRHPCDMEVLENRLDIRLSHV